MSAITSWRLGWRMLEVTKARQCVAGSGSLHRAQEWVLWICKGDVGAYRRTQGLRDATDVDHHRRKLQRPNGVNTSGLASVLVFVYLLYFFFFFVDFAQARILWAAGTLTEGLSSSRCLQEGPWGHWFMTDMGGSSPLWVVSPLARWSWLVQENKLSKHWGASLWAALLVSFCCSSCLRFLSWDAALPSLDDGLKYGCISQTLSSPSYLRSWFFF